jgi:inner membrane protein
MSEQGAAARPKPTRSMGLKLLLVCALAGLMSIPALLVFALLADRTHRAAEVTNEVGQLMGGPQTFLGPVIGVPYQVPSKEKDKAPAEGVYFLFPAEAQASVSAASELRKRSLFHVPVYRADLAFKARFDLAGATASAPPGATFDWIRAQVLIGASDLRGAQSDVVMTAAGKPLQVAPSALISDATAPLGEQGRAIASNDNLKFVGAPAAGFATPGAKFDVAASFRFSGAQRLAILAYGKTTTVQTSSDWPSPSFDGGFLPVRQQVGPKGFTAAWSVPFVARGVPAEGFPDVITRLGATSLGVSFVELANPYQSVGRSLKYALLFVGLVFLAYFVFESLVGKRVHPAQYVLIGLAQMIFYLLLLSIAERTGFDWAFVIAAAATVALISAYAGWVFESRRQGVIALVAFSVLYALIYVLMRLEDLALLVGAVASFAAIAAVMYLTRKLDWYGITETATKEPGRLT